MTEDRDETIERIAAALRPLPEVDDAAKARVLVAVAAERHREREHATGLPQRRARWTAAGIGAAAAVLLGVFALRQDRGPDATGRRAQRPAPAQALATAPSSGAASGALLAAHGDAAEAAPQPVQLVFRAPRARSVSVVGDFTDWDARRAEMTRDPASGLWSITLPLAPGRHVYAFIVDDSVWVRDPRAPVAPDADFGRPGSVVLVGGSRP